MSGLSNRRRTGTDARDALIEIITETSRMNADNKEALRRADHLIDRLQRLGFVIVSTNPQPARRGKYIGPAMIGQSHSARIVG